MALERWEVDAREFERTAGKDVADLTNLCPWLQMIPTQFEEQAGQLAGKGFGFGAKIGGRGHAARLSAHDVAIAARSAAGISSARAFAIAASAPAE